MIKTLLYNRASGETRRGDEALFADWAADPDCWIWADFDAEAPEREKALFQEVFGLHPLAISDAQRDRHPPKLEQFDDCIFLLVIGLSAETHGLEFGGIQLAHFVSDRFLVTRRNAESLSIDGVWAAAGAGEVDLARGPSHVAYHILRRVTDRYSAVIESLESRLDGMEDEMFENPSDTLLEELLGYGRNLKRLWRLFNYHQLMFARLSRKGCPFVGKSERHEFNDLFEHTERLTSFTALYKELADDLMNGYISMSSHRLNRIMKVLTVVTVIFLPLTLLAGIYGMNFEYMPELNVDHAYFIVLGTMAAIAAGLLLLFRKMRWL